MKAKHYLVGLIFLTFFVISFLSNILGPIIPDIIKDFDLNLGLAGFLPFAFFVAYGIMSIPAGMMVEKYGEKKSMVVAFLLATLGALLFALFPVFAVAMASLFTIGAGMAILQVAINPLLRTSGGESRFAFNSVVGQLFFGAASFLSPLVYSYMVTNYHNPEVTGVLMRTMRSITPEHLPWISLYWVFAFGSLLMVVIIGLTSFPTVERKEDEKAGGWQVYRELLRSRTVLLFFLGIFVYVGTEQGIANWMSQFLSTYHGLDPQVEGARAVSLFWGLMTAGTILGLVLLKLYDSKVVLRIFTLGTVIALAFALFGSANISVVAFPILGFTIATMWSIIVSLALNSVASHHGAFSGILVTGIVGGAIFPLVVGWLGESFGLRFGLSFLIVPLAYIFSISVWANPLIKNETIRRKNSVSMDS